MWHRYIRVILFHSDIWTGFLDFCRNVVFYYSIADFTWVLCGLGVNISIPLRHFVSSVSWDQNGSSVWQPNSMFPFLRVYISCFSELFLSISSFGWADFQNDFKLCTWFITRTISHHPVEKYLCSYLIASGISSHLNNFLFTPNCNYYDQHFTDLEIIAVWDNSCIYYTLICTFFSLY